MSGNRDQFSNYGEKLFFIKVIHCSFEGVLEKICLLDFHLIATFKQKQQLAALMWLKFPYQAAEHEGFLSLVLAVAFHSKVNDKTKCFG